MRSFAGLSVAFDAAEVAYEHQMLEMPANRREALEVLDRLLAPCLTAGAKCRADDLLEQRGLAVGGAPEHPEVPAGHAEAGELGGRPHDLEVGLVVGDPPVAAVGLHDPELLELTDQALGNARLVQDLLQRHGRDRRVDRPGAPGRRGLAATARPPEIPARELLPDDPQGEELVALHAQDRAEPLDVRLAVEAIAAGGPARGEQLLVLKVADLGDRDVVELLPEDLRDGADGERLARTRGRVVGRRAPLRLPAGLRPLLRGRDRHLSAPGSSACTCRPGSRRRPRDGATRSGAG